MNNRDRLFIRNRLLQKIKHTDRSGNKEGYVKIHSNNSYLHEKTKFEVAFALKKCGFEIWTECGFEGGRGDLVAIKNGKGYIIEILNSETEEMYNLKKDKYPNEFEIIKVNAKEFKMEDWKI